MPSSAPVRSPGLLRLLVVAGAVLGLFVMHGLSGHGSTHQSAGHADTTVSAPVGGAVVGEASHGGMPGTSEGGVDGGLDGGSPWGDSSGLLGLCVVVLGALAVGAVALWWRRARPLWAYGRPALLVPLPGAARRDRYPPSLVALSIQRC